MFDANEMQQAISFFAPYFVQPIAWVFGLAVTAVAGSALIHIIWPRR